jgi:PTS system ascorbate-specific IIB component
MKIITVCGMGIGTSVLLKMNAEKELGQVPAKVVVIDNFTNVAEIQQKIQDSIA